MFSNLAETRHVSESQIKVQMFPLASNLFPRAYSVVEISYIFYRP